MEEERHFYDKPFNPHFSDHQERSSKCLVYILILLVFLSISFLTSWHFVLRVKTPTLRLSAINIKHLQYNSSSLNMTVAAQLDLHNPNLGSFKFLKGYTDFLYENAIIGFTRIHHLGLIVRKKKRRLNATMKVIGSDHEIKPESYGNFRRDIGLGWINLRILGEVRGEVRVVKIISRRVSAVMNCNMDLNLKSQGIQDLMCS